MLQKRPRRRLALIRNFWLVIKFSLTFYRKSKRLHIIFWNENIKIENAYRRAPNLLSDYFQKIGETSEISVRENLYFFSKEKAE